MEDIRARVLTKALEQFPDQKAMPVWVHPQLDKLSQGWILSLPGHRGFTQAEFSETVARFLCLPSPCCQARIGEPLDQHGLHVDPFRDNVMSVSNIPGDMFRIRHDTVKAVINSFCMTSSLRSECEVYGLFRDLIPVEALENEEELARFHLRKEIKEGRKEEEGRKEGKRKHNKERKENTYRKENK